MSGRLRHWQPHCLGQLQHVTADQRTGVNHVVELDRRERSDQWVIGDCVDLAEAFHVGEHDRHGDVSEQRQAGGKIVRWQDVVGVEEAKYIAAGFAVGQTAVLVNVAMLDVDSLDSDLLTDRGSLVCARVVNHEHLERGDGLRANGLDTFAQEPAVVVADDRDSHARQDGTERRDADRLHAAGEVGLLVPEFAAFFRLGRRAIDALAELPMALVFAPLVSFAPAGRRANAWVARQDVTPKCGS